MPKTNMKTLALFQNVFAVAQAILNNHDNINRREQKGAQLKAIVSPLTKEHKSQIIAKKDQYIHINRFNIDQ